MKVSIYIIGIISAAILSLFIILSFFNQPVGDDIWYTWMAREYGFPEAQRQWFITINGRFSSNIFMSLNTWVYGSTAGFKVWPAVVIAGWVAAIYHLIKYVVFSFLNRWQSLSLSLLLVAVYYMNMPGIQEGCFCMSSVTGYQAGLLLFTVYFIMATGYSNQPAWRKYIFYPAYLFIAGGFHEMIACMAVAVGLYFIFIKWILRRKIAVEYLIFTIATGVAFLVQFFCIGNRNKAAITGSDEKLALHEVAIKAIAQTGYHFAKHCLLSPSFWIAIITVFYIAYSHGKYLSKITLPFKKAKWVLAGIVPFLVFFPPLLVIYIENNIAPLRVMNVSYFACTAAIYTATALYGAHLSEREKKVKLSSKIYNLRIVLTLLLTVAAVAFSYNTRKVMYAVISGQAYRYNKEVNKRFKMIENCTATVCELPCLKDQPVVLCPGDVCKDATLIRHLEKLFHKKLVHTDK